MARPHQRGRRQGALLLCSLAILLPLRASAATVSTTPSAGLAAAVAGLASGDVLQLAAGVYSGAAACSILVSAGRNITLTGPGSGAVAIDCGGAGRHMDVSGGATVRLVGVTLRNGAADDGGCLRVAGTGTLVHLVGSTASACTASNAGGALHASGGASVVIEASSVVLSLASTNGGGVYADGATVVARAQAQIVQNSAGGDGAGLFATGTSSVTLQGQSSVSGNAAARDGGGVFVSGSTLSVSDSTLSLNRGTINGGAILATATSTVTLSGATSLDRNTALRGAGLHATGGSSVAFSGAVTAKDNTAYALGSVVYSAASTLTLPTSVTLSGNRVPGEWDVAPACANAPKPNAAFDNAIVQEGGACSSLCAASFYEALPAQGDLISAGTCVACATSACSVGQYRGVCAGRASGECQACTNKVPLSTYTGAGAPFNANTCAYVCNAGYGLGGSVCTPCPAGTFKPAAVDNVCVPSCAATSYSSGSTGLTAPECTPCTTAACPYSQTRGACGDFADAVCVTCPLIPDNGRYVRNGTCDWECVPGLFREGDWCYPCPTTLCSVGQYRGVCAGYSGGGCTNCTNGPSAAAYTSPGQPYDANACEWACVDAQAPNTPRPGLVCGVGQYVGPCACEVCSNGPEFSAYTSTGTPLMNDCAWECVPGYFRTGDTCQKCGEGACGVGQYRGACDDVFGGTCVDCTNRPAGSMYTSPGEPFDSDACAWKCAFRYFASADGGCAACSDEPCGVGEYRGACTESADGPCLPCTTKPSDVSFYTSPGEPFDENTCAFDCLRNFTVLDEMCCPVSTIEFQAVLDVDSSEFLGMHQDGYLAAVRALAGRAAGEASVETCISITGATAAQGTRRQGDWTSVSTLLNVNDTVIPYVAMAMTAENITAELQNLGMGFGVRSLVMISNETWIIPRAPPMVDQGPGPDMTGAIVGGVVGGFFGLLMIIALVFKIKGWECPGFIQRLGRCLPSFGFMRNMFKSEGGQMKNKSGGAVLSSKEKKAAAASSPQKEEAPKKTPSIKKAPDVEVSNKPEVNKQADEKA